MTDRETVSIRAGADTVIFGRDGFVLHDLCRGAAKITAGRTAGRPVTFDGYILPPGDTAAQRTARMEVLVRRLCRIVTCPHGFILTVGEKHIRLLAKTAPAFAHEAPLNGDEASFFTVTADAAQPFAAYFLGGEEKAMGRGWRGALVFPLAIAGATVFARGTDAGEMTVFNPGDVPCGFVLSVRAQWHPIDSFTVVSPAGEILSVQCALDLGETLQIDTRPGGKTVTVEGQSVLSGLSLDSMFFSLQPGENRITWSCTGGGTPAMEIAFSPRYY